MKTKQHYSDSEKCNIIIEQLHCDKIYANLIVGAIDTFPFFTLKKLVLALKIIAKGK
jgi:hypothetical protein